MKRNRLTRSPSQKNLFSTTSARINKNRSLFALSSLALAGVFITSIVLATGKPEDPSTQSQVINLPNLPAEMQNISSLNISTQSISQANETHTSATAHPIRTETVAAPKEQLDISLSEPITLGNIVNIDTDNSVVEEEKSAPVTNWQEVTVKSGDNLSLIFPRVGLSARDVYNVALLGKDIKPLLNLKPGQVIRFDINDEQDSKQLRKIELQLTPIQTLNVLSTSEGYQVTLDTREVEQRQVHASGTIQSSLFGAGIEAGLSDKLIMELAYIFGWDIDFALDLRKDDTFMMIYSEDYLDGDKIADGAILAAEFTNQGKTFRAVRYTDDNDRSQYYSPKGDSMRKAFSRTPVHFSRISSKFNPNRKHPVLKTNRPHRGVDYAAARGTPILATGDGKISFRGTKGGYGRTIVLTHGGKYTTLYAHMSNFKKGLKTGSRVKQGQTIGFIGSSGLATGPHLHYEFRVNGVHRNPLTVSLPKAEALAKKYHKDFEQKSQPLLAQLDNLNSTALALND